MRLHSKSVTYFVMSLLEMQMYMSFFIKKKPFP